MKSSDESRRWKCLIQHPILLGASCSLAGGACSTQVLPRGGTTQNKLHCAARRLLVYRQQAERVACCTRVCIVQGLFLRVCTAGPGKEDDTDWEKRTGGVEGPVLAALRPLSANAVRSKVNCICLVFTSFPKHTLLDYS